MQTRDSQAPSVRVDLASPRVAVAVVGDRPTTDADWADYVETTAALDERARRTVVFTAGGAPTALQQAEHGLAPGPNGDARLAVITGAAGTTARWQGWQTARAFGPDELAQAFGFLGLSARERALVLALARRLARELRIAEAFEF